MNVDAVILLCCLRTLAKLPEETAPVKKRLRCAYLQQAETSTAVAAQVLNVLNAFVERLTNRQFPTYLIFQVATHLFKGLRSGSPLKRRTM